MANCYSCGQEITFDEYHVSAITGKKIPLNPGGSVPHDCPAKKKYPQASQGAAMRKSYPNTAPPQTDTPSDTGIDEHDDEAYDDKMRELQQSTKQQFFNQRDADIKEGHREKMEKYTLLTDVLKKLVISVDMNTAALAKLADRLRKDDDSVGFEFMSRSDNIENEP